ncbi:glycosyltransferase family 8 protein [Trichoderma citrinoviride]|uniref:glycogenin glucosyltransferase n=1 Tax=Trichoderma citrinoviride TaxID=58853 RepID=A0A2T4B2T9_9HYPO|nr:glycosyltransferase family 8 protein [Trichoderma citrinoviride]PTB63548.1 glycosyltransferase family 8 protein [Trichoderma citrinoviride]
MADPSWGEHAYATLLLNDAYLPGALVLAHSLRDAGTTKKLAVLVTLDGVTADAIVQLKTVYDYVLPVPRIRNDKPANLYLMNRADLHSAFTKINLWKQTQFSRIVYIDADVVAYRAPDELFDLPHAFAASPDIGWPDIFNTGVMALTPNNGDYHAMMAMAERGISFDGADQGLLNTHFKNNFHRLPFTYNVTPSAHYQYLPAYRHFQSSINMVHFIGPDKPWRAGRNASYGNGAYDEMVGRWWAVYDRHYREKLANNGGNYNQAYESQKNASLADTKFDAPAGGSGFQGQAPRQIFPWESHQPKATRSFYGDEPELQPQTPSRSGPAAAKSTARSSVTKSPPKSPASRTSENKSEAGTASWTTYSRGNAWDEVPGISKYADAVEKHHRSSSRGKEGEEGDDDEDDDEARGFKKVTDFPTETERPSLPVTPAPVPRGRDSTGKVLPAAEGVPSQSEWMSLHNCWVADVEFPVKDPAAQLEKLAQQQSAMLLRKLGGHKEGFSGGTRIAQSAPVVLSPRPVKGTAAAATRSLERRMNEEEAGGKS